MGDVAADAMEEADGPETVSVVVDLDDGGAIVSAEPVASTSAINPNQEAAAAALVEISNVNKDSNVTSSGNAASKVAAYIDLTNDLPLDTVLEVSTSRLLDHFSLFDLLLHRAKTVTPESPDSSSLMETILTEVGMVLADLKVRSDTP